MHKQALIEKYNVPVPRYTSYPTVPYWQEKCPSEKEWKQQLLNTFKKGNEISLYIHLPYCESLCTFCGCNKRITKNHTVEIPYIEAVLKEWKLYIDLFEEKPILKELHLGGGTPTFFSPHNLQILINGILKEVSLPDQYELGFEAHPNSTTPEHLEVFRDLGFTRLSIGIQDFDNEILKIINRHQSYEDVKRVTDLARSLGYDSLNYDLIFGLPLQTEKHIRHTMSLVNYLLPDRIAFYSYAHVPWHKPSQRAYSEKDLPQADEKRKLYELGRSLLEDAGYVEIGLDHFSLPTDSLYHAMNGGHLHRNFMGYTTNNTKINLALGVSGISDSHGAYAQNEKVIEEYRKRIDNGELPLIKGHILSEQDIIIRQHINNIMCQYKTSWNESMKLFDDNNVNSRLVDLQNDGLIEFGVGHIAVTAKGKPFVRNVCLAIDPYHWKTEAKEEMFSKSV